MTFSTKKLMIALAVSALAQTVVAAPTLATVNNHAIPALRSDILTQEYIAQGAPDNADLRAEVKKDLIRDEIIVQEANRLNLQNDPKLKETQEMAKRGVLVRAYIQDYIQKHPISDAALQTEYNNGIAKLGKEEYKARHILVSSEDAAKKIITELKAGKNFATLAKASSIDNGTKNDGGELGWINPNMLVPAFSDALRQLVKVNDYTTTPVKTDFGYHIIQLEGKRPITPPKFEDIKSQLRQRLEQIEVQKNIEELVSKAKVS